jgi:hypothetical protein
MSPGPCSWFASISVTTLEDVVFPVRSTPERLSHPVAKGKHVPSARIVKRRRILTLVEVVDTLRIISRRR